MKETKQKEGTNVLRQILRTTFNLDGNDSMVDVCGNTVKKKAALDRFQPFLRRMKHSIIGY